MAWLVTYKKTNGKNSRDQFQFKVELQKDVNDQFEDHSDHKEKTGAETQ